MSVVLIRLMVLLIFTRKLKSNWFLFEGSSARVRNGNFTLSITNSDLFLEVNGRKFIDLSTRGLSSLFAISE